MKASRIKIRAALLAISATASHAADLLWGGNPGDGPGGLEHRQQLELRK